MHFRDVSLVARSSHGVQSCRKAEHMEVEVHRSSEPSHDPRGFKLT